jgi:hypothetical protein
MTVMSGEIVRILLYVPQHEDRGGVEVVCLTFLAYIFDGYEWVDSHICYFLFGK